MRPAGWWVRRGQLVPIGCGGGSEREGPAMAFYSRVPLRALRQVMGDVFVVLWTVLWVQAGLLVHAAVDRLRTPLTALQEGADNVSQNFSEAGQEAARVPLVGRELARPLERASEAMAGLAGAGGEQSLAVHQLAWWAGVAVAAVPVCCLLLVWLPGRWRFVLASVSAHRLCGTPAGRELLALRALTSGPAGAVLALGPDPVAAWRAGDPRVLAELTELELRRTGVRGVLPR